MIEFVGLLFDVFGGSIFACYCSVCKRSLDGDRFELTGFRVDTGFDMHLCATNVEAFSISVAEGGFPDLDYTLLLFQLLDGLAIFVGI